MFKSKYFEDLYNKLATRYSDEKEYLQTVEEMMITLEDYSLNNPWIMDKKIIDRFLEPERTIKFRVSWVDDKGQVNINHGYRIQFNSAIGPFKGGLRFHPSVNESIIKFLGLEQTLKNSLTGLPLGGGKGGADFDPSDKSDNEIMSFCQAFMSELYRHIGENTDVPAGDIGVGTREIGYLYGAYKRIQNRHAGILTGKGLSYSGSLIRKEATGYGICYFTNCVLDKYLNTSLKGKKVIVSGSGNVGIYAALKAKELGATVIAMSDISGYIHDEKGIDIELVKKIKEIDRKLLKEYKNYHKDVEFNPNAKEMWKIKCDIPLPCATQNEIDLESAKALVNNGIIAIIEGANMPCTLDAIRYFKSNKIIFGPAKAANAGGVATSGLEMSQNATHYNWSAKDVDDKLKEIMNNIFNNIYNTAVEMGEPSNLLLGANICGFKKVAQAMLEEGVI